MIPVASLPGNLGISAWIQVLVLSMAVLSTKNLFWLVVYLPLWKIWRIVSWDDEIPDIWKHKNHDPNHQPDNHNWIRLIASVIFHIANWKMDEHDCFNGLLVYLWMIYSQYLGWCLQLYRDILGYTMVLGSDFVRIPSRGVPSVPSMGVPQKEMLVARAIEFSMCWYSFWP